MKKFTLFLICLAGLAFAQAQPFSASYFTGMQWRMIGPHRGGRTVGACGVPSQPNVFYIGVNNGGVWKTDDYGRTWNPIFDKMSTGSVGDIAVAESNPDVIYVGSGEGIQRPDLSVGDGIYKSTDAGKTWTNMGLHDAQQIGGIVVDPKNENRVFVAALGHPYGPNTERGVYRSLDGGKTWQRILYKDENTGAIQVSLDPNNSNIIYADLWAGRQGPWENGQWNGSESGLYKSTDGGDTWKKLTKGLPTTEQGLGRIGFGIAPTNSNRLYATVDAGNYGGIYRSDDAGESWTLMSKDGRFWGRGSDFAEVKVDPTNADIVYSANVVTWKSVDGAKTWTGFRGAPGGDDYHR
ncbi:MAG: glycoside hydrolase, partial [Bacteroidota bacterium]|nr:glycoside hydrolase [Bacteroidota bacterium]